MGRNKLPVRFCTSRPLCLGAERGCWGGGRRQTQHHDLLARRQRREGQREKAVLRLRVAGVWASDSPCPATDGAKNCPRPRHMPL